VIPGKQEFLAFPRLAVAAEIGWSPAAARKWDDFAARVAAQEPRWMALGINFYHRRRCGGTMSATPVLSGVSMNLDLRPLTIGELFDRAFTLYRRHLWMFAGVAAVPAVLAAAMGVAMQVAQRLAVSNVNSAAQPEAADVIPVVILVGGAVFVLAVAYWVVYMAALGATTFAVSELYVGRGATVRAAYAGMRGRVGALVVLMLLIGMRVGVLMVAGGATVTLSAGLAGMLNPVVSAALIIGGILLVGGLFLFMVLRYGLAVPALVVEGLSPGDAIRRSIELTKGRLGRVFLLGLCALMVTYAAMMIFQAPFAFGAVVANPLSATGFWLDIAGAVFGAAGSTFTTPFLIIGLALLYYDARIREEGFDLQLTLEALDARAGVAQA
jgi:hypothetical protein